MEKYLYKGKEESELVKHACEELQVETSEIFYKTSEEKGGLFSGKKVVVEVVKVKDVLDLGKTILKNIIEGMNIKANIETKVRDNLISYSIFSENNSMLIGKKGRILEAIQYYLKQVILSKIGISVNIIVDVENYRKKQLYYLTRDVKKIAREVTLSKVDVKLDPMNSYERRLVHEALVKFDYIETESIGEEPNRCVVVKYKEKSTENKQKTKKKA